MIRKLFLAGCAVCLFCLPAFAQEGTATLDEVLADYYQAVGGLDTMKSVHAIRMSGKMTMGEGLEAPVTMLIERPNRMRLEFVLQGMTGIQAYDGKTAWQVMPFMGKTEPQPIPPDQAKDLEEEADMDGPLVDWQAKGHQVELEGKEEIEGTPAYKLKVTLKSGDVSTYYLDADAYLPIKIEGVREVQGHQVEYETTLSDYKEEGGLMLPHSIESKPKGADSGQAITIEKVEINPEVDPAIFAMPEAKPEAAPPSGRR